MSQGVEIPEVLDEEAFDHIVGSEAKPSIVAFTASWCAPCRWLYPYLDAIAARAGGQYQVLKADVDRLPGVIERYRIASVPTVILFHEGREQDRSVGVEPERLDQMARSIGPRLPDTP